MVWLRSLPYFDDTANSQRDCSDLGKCAFHALRLIRPSRLVWTKVAARQLHGHSPERVQLLPSCSK